MRKLLSGLVIAFLFLCGFSLIGHWSSAQDSLPNTQQIQEPDLNLDGQEEFGDTHRELEDYEEDYDQEEFEEQEELEMELLEQELVKARIEFAHSLTEVAEFETTTATYVIDNILEYLEVEEAIEFLKQMVEQAENPTTKRLLRMKLAQLFAETDQTDQTKEQLSELILSG